MRLGQTTYNPDKVRDIQEGIEDRINELKAAIAASKQGVNLDGTQLTKYSAQSLRTRSYKDLATLRLVSECLDLHVRERQALYLGRLAVAGLNKLVWPQIRGKRKAEEEEEAEAAMLEEGKDHE